MAEKPKSNPTQFLTRILATAAVWSIVVVFAERVKVPMVDLILLVLGGALSFLIWKDPPTKERN